MVRLLVGLAVAVWFSTYYAVFDYVRKRRKLIEAEIPRFALTIGQNLENDRDVLKILTSYRRVAGRDYGAELDQTIADMITSNYENALLPFETRIGRPMLSAVVRGRVGVLFRQRDGRSRALALGLVVRDEVDVLGSQMLQRLEVGFVVFLPCHVAFHVMRPFAAVFSFRPIIAKTSASETPQRQSPANRKQAGANPKVPVR